MFWTVLYTPGIRFFQGLAGAAPTLLIGIVLAGLLRAMAGPEQIRRLFGGADRRGLARTFLVAVLLPVGSLGMLPVAREMARARVPLANLVLLAVVAPLLSPLAMVHGLTSLAGSTLGLLAAGGVLAGLGAWLLVPRPDGEEAPSDPLPTATTPLRRVLNTGIAVSRIASGMTLVDVLVALGFGALAAMAFDTHELTHQLSEGSTWAAPIMGLVALPAYVAPAAGIGQMYGMEAMQFSLTALLALHLFGVGQNLAALGWLGRRLGTIRTISILAVMLALAWTLGLLGDAWANPYAGHLRHEQDHQHDHPHVHGAGCCGGGDVEHNHALVTLGRWEYVHFPNPIHEAFRFTKPAEYVPLVGLGLFVLLGLGLRVARLDLLRDPPGRDTAVASRLWGPIPGRWLAVIGGAGLGALVVGMVYVYYPPVDEIRTQMRFVKVNTITAVRSGHDAAGLRELGHWEDQARKLPMAALLRGRRPPPEGRQAVDEFLRQAERLRQAMLSDRPPEERLQIARDVMEAHQRCSRAFRDLD
jgi:uncharacterized membrane protein YraQ (UPF0718 family)